CFTSDKSHPFQTILAARTYGRMFGPTWFSGDLCLPSPTTPTLPTVVHCQELGVCHGSASVVLMFWPSLMRQPPTAEHFLPAIRDTSSSSRPPSILAVRWSFDRESPRMQPMGS